MAMTTMPIRTNWRSRAAQELLHGPGCARSRQEPRPDQSYRNLLVDEIHLTATSCASKAATDPGTRGFATERRPARHGAQLQRVAPQRRIERPTCPQGAAHPLSYRGVVDLTRNAFESWRCVPASLLACPQVNRLQRSRGGPPPRRKRMQQADQAGARSGCADRRCGARRSSFRGLGYPRAESASARSSRRCGSGSRCAQ